MKNTNLTLGSLFDGSGGFPLGGLLAGITPVWASEIEPFPIRVTTKRLPFMKHYGDVTKMDGAAVEPVDIITFGSPCTDLSIAGRRAGLGGQQSSLFYEAIRIVKEMRCATNGRYPRWICWENVVGAYSSNSGADFKAVLDAVIGIVEPEAEVPPPEKGRWPTADCYMGDGWSLAYRTLDAQYWGVPQRRRRIFLVADFAGGSAGEILFKSEGLSRYSAAGCCAWEGTTGGTPACVGAAGRYGNGIVLNDQGGGRMEVSDNVAATLRAEAHGHPPCVLAAGFCTEHSAKSRTIGYEEERSPTLRAGVVPAALTQEQKVFENHSQDTRYVGPIDVAPTVSATYGSGGNNQPFVVKESAPLTLKIRSGCEGGGKGALIQKNKSATLSCNNDQTVFVPQAFGIGSFCSAGMMSDNPKAGVYEAKTSRTIDQAGGNPTCHQGGIAIVEHGPTYALTTGAYTQVSEETCPTLLSRDYKDATVVSEPTEVGYSVRRLSPTECARLQGFPDWWCADLSIDEPTKDDLEFWSEVWETHRRVLGTSTKPKSLRQIQKWLQDPHSDAAEYKMWGNGVSLPCVFFVLAGIAWASEQIGTSDMHNSQSE